LFLPAVADVSNQIQALLIPPGQTTQRGQMQTEVRLKLSDPLSDD
jgi:hypothetical protein